MLGRYPNIYHFHIRKCGGTSVTGWLNRHVNDRRLFEQNAFPDREWDFDVAADAEAQDKLLSDQAVQMRQTFFVCDVVSTHIALRDAFSDAAFRLTVLRDPTARVISQISDWRRLGPHDLLGAKPLRAQAVSQAKRLSVSDFLKTYGKEGNILDNHMTQALAALALAPGKRRAMSLAQMAEVAIETLETRLDFVGIAEQPRETLARLADRLGLAPDPTPPRMNETRSGERLAAEAAEAEESLAELTHYDRLVYNHALRLFARRDGAGYDRAAFECTHAADAARQLAGRLVDGDVVFSVRDPILGSGFHGRDGQGLENCCVWSGPASAFVLYMPAPPGARLQIKLWVRGYADLAQRAALQVRVDGEPQAHQFAPAPGYAEVVVTEVRARRPFVALEVDVGATTTTGEIGAPSHDARLRGLAFDRYGWRALPD